jgi:hypothetical protein
MITPRAFTYSSFGVATYIIVGLAFIAACGVSKGIEIGERARQCPLIEGQPLVSVNRSTGQCNYASPMVAKSAVELRRMIIMQARMEKTK